MERVFEYENLGDTWMVWETVYVDGVGSSTACCDHPTYPTKKAAKAHVDGKHATFECGTFK